MGYFDSYEAGKAAFLEGAAVTDSPFEFTKSQRQAWKSGFLEAKREAEAEKEQDAWEQFAQACPWYDGVGECRALNGMSVANSTAADRSQCQCIQSNCAPLYFSQHWSS